MATETVRGGAPPHTDTLIRTAACGRVQIGPFKNEAPLLFVLFLLCSDPRVSTCCTDDPEAGRGPLALTSAETNYLGESKTL